MPSKLKYCALVLILFTSSLFGYSKTFLITLPVVSIGKEGDLRAQYNLQERGSLGFSWTQWEGKGRREELSKADQKKNPKDSLLSEGRELGLFFASYNDFYNMSGFYWGLGLAYRIMNLDWVHSKYDQKSGKEEQNQYHIIARGPSTEARVGYQFVGEDIGVTIGTFLGFKYFISDISDQANEDNAQYSYIGAREKSALQYKIATLLKIGIEIGWAF